MSTPDVLLYWSGDMLAANGWIAVNVLGALFLGMLIGYERSYQGRAAGMRTYGLVCMASSALTVALAFPSRWFGGALGADPGDATRVVQGIVTGIGFLCAGVIVKDGMSIRGLTTAASIWAVSVIGILLGAGFYPAALFLALLCAFSLSLLHRIEALLPGRSTLEVIMTFKPDADPDITAVITHAQRHGYRVLRDSIAFDFRNRRATWKFAAIAQSRVKVVLPTSITRELAVFPDIESLSVQPVRM